MKKLYVRQKVFKLTDHYPVMDEHQNELYHVDQDFQLIGLTVHVQDARGVERFVVEKKLLAWMPQFIVRFTDGREATIRSRLAFLRRHIEIETDRGESLRLIGSFWDLEFQVMRDDTVVAEVSKEFLSWADTYQITIHDETYEEIIIALMICIDHLKDGEQH